MKWYYTVSFLDFFFFGSSTQQPFLLQHFDCFGLEREGLKIGLLEPGLSLSACFVFPLVVM